MEEAMKVALIEYGRTIQSEGWAAGEPLILVHESRIPDFRRLATALAIMLRTEELLAD